MRKLALGLLLLAAACSPRTHSDTMTSSSTIPPFNIDGITPETFAPGLDVYIVRKGTGQPAKPGETVIAHYHGMLTDGKVFDSSYKRGQPFEFKPGKGQVIQGWDLAFAKLPVGTQARLVLAPEMGYGSRGAGDAIPPNSTLWFDVEVLGTRP